MADNGLMNGTLHDGLERLARHDCGVLVQVARTQGSTPRETGAWMMVWADGQAGTIGGGQLEYQACADARALLAGTAGGPQAETLRRYTLGPDMGQCCGGVVLLRLQCIGPADAPRLAQELAPPLQPLGLFGGGHVALAIVRLLASLPYAVYWVDSREDVFPVPLPPKVRAQARRPVQSAVAELAPGSQVLAMSYSHPEDLEIVAACLERQRRQADLPFIGLIGSKTKWSKFRHRLGERGFTARELAHVTCPIGIPGLAGKEPEVIAVAVAAQLLMLQPAAAVREGGMEE